MSARARRRAARERVRQWVVDVPVVVVVVVVVDVAAGAGRDVDRHLGALVDLLPRRRLLADDGPGGLVGRDVLQHRLQTERRQRLHRVALSLTDDSRNDDGLGAARHAQRHRRATDGGHAGGGILVEDDALRLGGGHSFDLGLEAACLQLLLGVGERQSPTTSGTASRPLETEDRHRLTLAELRPGAGLLGEDDTLRTVARSRTRKHFEAAVLDADLPPAARAARSRSGRRPCRLPRLRKYQASNPPTTSSNSRSSQSHQ